MGVATIDGGNDGQPDSVRAVHPGPDAVLRALRGGVVLGPPITEADRAPVIEPTAQPDVPEHPEAVPEEGSIVDVVPLTFYVCDGAPVGLDDGYCGRMASGATVYRGAAACGYAWPLGTQFTIQGDSTGLVFTCEDRGLGPAQWVDVWFYDYAEGRAWRNQLPKYVTVEVKP